MQTSDFILNKSRWNKGGEVIINKKDFNEVVKENMAFVTSIVRKFVKDPETIKDLTQEIFLKAYLNYERYSEDGKLKAWLAVIAHNMLKDHYKTEQYQSGNINLSHLEYVSDELLPSKNMPEDIVIQQDLLDKTTKVINSLPEKQRDIIIYSYFYDYSEKEIASIQNMSLSAVKSSKYYGLQKVRNIISAEYGYMGTGYSDHKYRLNNNFGRYRMIKCYAYGNGRFDESTNLQNDSIIEIISPSKKEIADTARFFTEKGGGISEDHIKALLNGDFDKLKEKGTRQNNSGTEYIASARINDALNILITPDYIITGSDDKNYENKDLMYGLQKIMSMYKVPAYINVDLADIYSLFSGVKNVALGTGRGKGAKKYEAPIRAVNSSQKLANIIDGSLGMMLSITASPNTKLGDIDIITSKIREMAAKDSYLIWGLEFDSELDDDEIILTMLATDQRK